MGDFDRIENSGKNNQNKKMAIVLVLGVVLIGLVAFESTKRGGPLPVGASTVSGPASSQTPSVDETPDQVRRALQNDPTRSLLLGGGEPEQNFERMPRNPFQLSETWRRTLTHAAPMTTPVDTVIKPTVTPRIFAPLRIEDYKLNMIVRQSDQLAAIVNGVMVYAGSVVGKARVIQIREDGVQLQNIDSPDGPATWLKLR